MVLPVPVCPRIRGDCLASIGQVHVPQYGLLAGSPDGHLRSFVKHVTARKPVMEIRTLYDGRGRPHTEKARWESNSSRGLVSEAASGIERWCFRALGSTPIGHTGFSFVNGELDSSTATSLKPDHQVTPMPTAICWIPEGFVSIPKLMSSCDASGMEASTYSIAQSSKPEDASSKYAFARNE